MADVLRLPVPEPDCRDCVHAMLSPARGTWCGLFRELILSEAVVAADCDAWERA